MQKQNNYNERADVRKKILSTACALFYDHGIHSIGVDLIVEKAGVAKSSLYRHFATKDDLVVAFLQEITSCFWETWDNVSTKYADDAKAELYNQLCWIGDRTGEPNYRGCPNINIVAEFSDADHPARKFAEEHKLKLRRSLNIIAEKLNCKNPHNLAGQLALIINGAFVSTSIYQTPDEARTLLCLAADAILAANGIK